MTIVSFCGVCDWGTEHEVKDALDADGPYAYGLVERWQCVDCGCKFYIYYDVDSPEHGYEVTQGLWWYDVLIGGVK